MIVLILIFSVNSYCKGETTWKCLRFNTLSSSEHCLTLTVYMYAPAPASVYTATGVDILYMMHQTTLHLHLIARMFKM